VLDNVVGGNTGIGFNKAPDEPSIRPPDVMVANASLSWRGGSLAQSGPPAHFGPGVMPDGWLGVATQGVAYGDAPPVSLLAPKPFAPTSPLRRQAPRARAR
jgi:hypothetical protein